MPSFSSRLAQLAIAFAVVAADCALALSPAAASYTARAIAGLALWVAAMRWLPLARLDDYPAWGNWRVSTRWTLLVAGCVAAAGLLAAATASFVLRSGWLGGLEPPFAIGDLRDAGGFLVTACLAAPIVEEFVYRGVVHPRLRAAAGPWIAVAAAGPVFWAAHCVAHRGLAALNTLLAGWLLASVYERTRSLLAPTVLHALGNLTLLAVDIAWFRCPGVFTVHLPACRAASEVVSWALFDDCSPGVPSSQG
jgi:hypothetical protein